MATLALEVEGRAALAGLTLGDVARAMGTTTSALSQTFCRPNITEELFLRLTRALGMRVRDWDTPVPERPSPVELAQKIQARARELRRSETEKKSARKKAGGGSGESC